jgi:hypothetical protein
MRAPCGARAAGEHSLREAPDLLADDGLREIGDDLPDHTLDDLSRQRDDCSGLFGREA